MQYLPTIALTCVAMLAFAGNSLLCRLALARTAIDPASFTLIRLVAGAWMLWLVVRLRGPTQSKGGTWLSALALFAYAAGFSFAYTGLSAATGALLLFGAVQATMIGAAAWSAERFHAWQWLGLLFALVGLIWLLLPGLSAPPLIPAGLMVAAGVSWGVYSLRGRGAGDPTEVTAGNFARSVPLALLLTVILLSLRRMPVEPNAVGLWCAVASGAATSGLGYAVWYAALRRLKSSAAAVVQLSVPVLATLGGEALLGEPVTTRVAGCSAAILGGIALFILGVPRTRPPISGRPPSGAR